MGEFTHFNINNNSLIYYSRIGKLDVVTKLLESPEININAQNRYDSTALIYASRHGYSTIVQKLLANKADCNIQDEDKSTALIWASRNRRIDIIHLLTKYNAQYYLQDKHDMTALKWAYSIKCSNCIIKNDQIIKILKDYESKRIREIILSVAPYLYTDVIELIIKFIL